MLIDLKGTTEPLEPQRAMEDVVLRFEPRAKLPEDADKVAEIYRDLLQRNKALLILDNAKDSAQVLPLLPPAPSAAIVTSRANLDLPGVTPRRLDCLARDGAIAVLAAIVEGGIPHPQAAVVAAALLREHLRPADDLEGFHGTGTPFDFVRSECTTSRKGRSPAGSWLGQDERNRLRQREVRQRRGVRQHSRSENPNGR